MPLLSAFNILIVTLPFTFLSGNAVVGVPKTSCSDTVFLLLLFY